MNTTQFRQIMLGVSIAIACLSDLGVAAQEKTDDDVRTVAAFDELIQQRIQDWQPTKEERLLDQIGWASDLVEAKRLAKSHERPLFVFTYSGSATRTNAIALRRC